MNNENTWRQGGEHYTLGFIGGIGEGQSRGSWGGIALGEMPDVGEEEEDSKSLPQVYLCNCLACSAHVPQNLKCNFKKKQKYIYKK